MARFSSVVHKSYRTILKQSPIFCQIYALCSSRRCKEASHLAREITNYCLLHDIRKNAEIVSIVDIHAHKHTHTLFSMKPITFSAAALLV